MSINVQVVVRARPPSQREMDMESPIVLEMMNQCTYIKKTRGGIAVGETKDDSKQFKYDFSYWSVHPTDAHYVSQEQVFEDLGKKVLESAFEGYNVCVFAYGQTGSGKTYTMMGSESAPGLIPRICENLFSRIATGSLRNVSYQTEASYMEIYNENVRDLLCLDAHKKPHNLRVREHPKEGPYVEKLSKHSTADYGAIQHLMGIGNSHRVTASTKMNDASSRSHAIFTITFTQATYSGDLPCETVSKIHLVDLAGSERASATGAEGIRLKEGGNINRSLVSLGNVISALADLSSHSTHQKKPFIPYRDSVLTWLLKDSLGGNSKTIMIATVSPAECCYSETLSTLRYANRAKNIVNQPVINEDPNVRLIKELREEIKRLMTIISSGSSDSGSARGRANSMQLAADIYRKEEQIAKLTKTWAQKWDDIKKILEERNLALSTEGVKMTMASERPYFLALDDNSLGAGVTLYHLKDESTTIGSEERNPPPDIVLLATDITADHCELMYSNGQVLLQPNEGKCSINGEMLTSPGVLSHGDIVMFGDLTLFKFNHPEEASKLKKMPLKELSPITTLYRTRDVLQMEALEKGYEEKLKLATEELEKKRESETAQLRLEVERLKHYAAASDASTPPKPPRMPTSEPSAKQCPDLDSDPSYNLMRSIAFEPIAAQPGVLKAGKGSPSIQPSFSLHDEACRDMVASSSKLSLQQYGCEDVDESFVVIEPIPRLLEASTCEHDQFDIHYVSAHLEQFQVDQPLQPVDHEHEIHVPEESVDPGTGERCQSAIDIVDSTVESLLDNVVYSRSVPETTLGHQEEIDGMLSGLNETTDENSHNSVETRSLQANMFPNPNTRMLDMENEILKRRLEEVESQLLKRDSLSIDAPEARRRSYAFGSKDQPPTPEYHRKRSRSMRGVATIFKVKIPRYFLRGNGLNAYHVYEVKIRLGREEWTIYRRYSEFRDFHLGMKSVYPELSQLTLPPAKYFGFRRIVFVDKRREQLEVTSGDHLQDNVCQSFDNRQCIISFMLSQQPHLWFGLQHYLQSFLAICTSLARCPLSETGEKKLTKEVLGNFSNFFLAIPNLRGPVS